MTPPAPAEIERVRAGCDTSNAVACSFDGRGCQPVPAPCNYASAILAALRHTPAAPPAPESEVEAVARAEEKRLLGIIAWCRPRLMHEYYRGALDRYVADPNLATNADYTPMLKAGQPMPSSEDWEGIVAHHRRIIETVVKEREDAIAALDKARAARGMVLGKPLSALTLHELQDLASRANAALAHRIHQEPPDAQP